MESQNDGGGGTGGGGGNSAAATAAVEVTGERQWRRRYRRRRWWRGSRPRRQLTRGHAEQRCHRTDRPQPALGGPKRLSISDNNGGDEGNQSPTTNTSEQVQQAAHDEDPDTYCSLDEVNEGGWRDVDDGQMAFAYLPVFVGSTDEITSELDNETSNYTYIPYSTDKILLTSTPLGSGTVANDEIADVSVKQVTIGLRDGLEVKKCGPETTLKLTPVGSKKIKYLSTTPGTRNTGRSGNCLVTTSTPCRKPEHCRILSRHQDGGRVR